MKKINFNSNWYFKFGENIDDEKNISLSDYDLIGLPHSFGIPYYGENEFYVGYGTYYKKFNIDFNKDNEVVLLEFGAVFQVADIYVNGKKVGNHEGGYTAFTVDITNYLICGENTLFIRVDNLWRATLAPRAGEHTFNGGIYRDVNLIIYPKSHIDWYGTKIKTEKTDENKYEIHITTNCTLCDGKELTNSILDADKNVIAKSKSIVKDNQVLQTIELDNPTLWDVDNPYLYTLKTEVCDDVLYTEFGVRTILWDKDKGFFLNGKHLLLQGANVHQDHGGWGDAVTHSGIKRDISLMKGCGFNFIRGSHYPHHIEFARECDRQGMLFWSENVFWGIGGFVNDGYWNSSAMPVKKEHYESFENSLKTQLYEMIHTNYNSPSIICWSMGNEIFFSKEKVLEDARQLVKRMVDYCHTLDDTRPAGIGGTQRGDFDILGDVAGYNGDGAVLFKNPPVANMVAEYGSIADYRPGKIDLYETKGSNEYYDWRAGRCIWCGFHHGSIAGIGNLGICDLYRLPLNAYYAYRKEILGIDIPNQSVKSKPYKLKLTTDKTEINGNGNDDCMLICEVLDKNNNRVKDNFEITFHIDDGSLLLPTGKSMTFNKKLKNCFDGMCAIEARGYYDSISTVYATCGDLKSECLKIKINSDEKFEKQNIVYKSGTKTSLSSSKKKINLIENRPVTVSSEKEFGSSVCLTTNSNFSYWSPQFDDSKPYIILDMENCYSNFNIKINKKLLSKLECNIYYSIDKENWICLEQSTTKIKFKCKNQARYIKINVNLDCKLSKIKIYNR